VKGTVAASTSANNAAPVEASAIDIVDLSQRYIAHYAPESCLRHQNLAQKSIAKKIAKGTPQVRGMRLMPTDRFCARAKPANGEPQTDYFDEAASIKVINSPPVKVLPPPKVTKSQQGVEPLVH